MYLNTTAACESLPSRVYARKVPDFPPSDGRKSSWSRSCWQGDLGRELKFRFSCLLVYTTPALKLGVCPLRTPAVLGCRAEEIQSSRRQCGVEGGERESCPRSHVLQIVMGDTWLQKLFYVCVMSGGKLCSLFFSVNGLNYLPCVFIDCDQPHPVDINPWHRGWGFWQLTPQCAVLAASEMVLLLQEEGEEVREMQPGAESWRKPGFCDLV